MTLQLGATTFDCQDALKVATFWSAALDRPIDQGVPEPSPFFASIGRADEGAGVHDKDEWGLQWTTLADPEGNEFCVAGP